MAVYVDAAIWHWAGRRWCHLLADDIDQLHRFAALLGIRRSSFQGPPKSATPHYDLTGFERSRALALGAIACDRQQIVMLKRRLQSQAAGNASGQDCRAVAMQDRVNKRDRPGVQKRPQSGEMRRQTSHP
jgi:hypothetical protein